MKKKKDDRPPRITDDLHDLIIFWGRYRLVAQVQRMAWARRIEENMKLGVGADTDDPAFTETLNASRDGLRAFEDYCDDRLVGIVKNHPLAPWIKEQRGFGLSRAGQLLAVTGSLDNFAGVSKLWRFLGLDVVDGRAPKRERGKTLHHNPRGRVCCYLLGDELVRSGGDGRWRAYYDTKRADYLAKERTGPSGCPMGHEHFKTQPRKASEKKGALAVIPCVHEDEKGVHSAHVDRAAKRYAVKKLLAAMWSEWRRYRTHEGA